MRAMSPEEPFQDSLDEDVDGFSEPGRGSRIRNSVYTKTPEMESNYYGDYGATVDKSPLLKTLMNSEAAANSAAIQLMSFKETLEDDFAVSKVKDKAVSRESSFQTKILELEGEKSRRENELKQIKQSNQLADKKFEVRLKDLQLSLNQSESHKQSIQNYVDFLKNSYSTIFDEGLPPATSSFGSSYFLK